MLILLIPVLSLCGATEYYVRPTEPTNTSCPAQPCLTLNQYINDSDHYFQFNTVFKFLHGIHHMDKPIIRVKALLRTGYTAACTSPASQPYLSHRSRKSTAGLGTEAESGHHVSRSDFTFTFHFSRSQFTFTFIIVDCKFASLGHGYIHVRISSSRFIFHIRISRSRFSLLVHVSYSLSKFIF